MAILKNKLKASYTDIPNELITDSKVSHGAFRVAVYLFSKPNDWHVNNTDIKKQLGIKDNQTLANYWKCLITSGWLSREKERDEKGNYTGSYEYSINLTPNCGKTLIRENTESGKNPIHNNPDFLTNPDFLLLKEKIGEKQYKLIAKLPQIEQLNPALKSQFFIWLSYKKKNKPYKTEEGLKRLLTRFIKREKDIEKLVDYSITNEYQGIIWEKEFKENNKRNGNGTSKRDYDEAEQTRIAISAAEQVLADRRAKAAFYSQ